MIFDLGNEIEGVLTGAYNVTLTAAFFTAEDSITPADKILPISPQLGSQDEASVFTVPPDTASSVWTLPRNVKKAVFTIAATGQIDEEVRMQFGCLCWTPIVTNPLPQCSSGGATCCSQRSIPSLVKGYSMATRLFVKCSWYATLLSRRSSKQDLADRLHHDLVHRWNARGGRLAFSHNLHGRNRAGALASDRGYRCF